MIKLELDKLNLIRERKVVNLFTAKGHLDIHIIFHGLHKITNLMISLL